MTDNLVEMNKAHIVHLKHVAVFVTEAICYNRMVIVYTRAGKTYAIGEKNLIGAIMNRAFVYKIHCMAQS